MPPDRADNARRFLEAGKTAIFNVLHLQEIANKLASVAIPFRPSEAGVEAGPVLARAVLSAAERLGLRNRHLAAVLGSSEASVSRLQGARTLDPASKEGELALLFLRVYRSLDALVGGDDDKARRWMHSDNDHLRGVPAERMRSVEGLVDVVQYLDAMRGRL